MIVFKDTENNVFTLYTLEKGGPIISDASLDIAKEKFNNALKLAKAIKKFLIYEKENSY